MCKLEKNEDYLVGVILPELQKIQRESTKMPRISLDVSPAHDNGMIAVHTTLYDGNEIVETVMFPFYSHVSVMCLSEKMDELKDYIKKHSA